ncbi:MAG: hypothetical protein JNL08_14915 [Planctomycetes bacterium]|nr:hypothetical protein [Planctomycetota bacterium]
MHAVADDRLQSPGPVHSLGGFAGRAPGDHARRPPARPAPPPGAVDRVTIHGAGAVAGRLLRERVLACTRQQLELGDTGALPEFAEVLEGEPIAAFLGRLLSAQNLLAARRAGEWPEARVRGCLDAALQAGADEALDVLAATGADPAGLMVVTEVLAEYGRRLAALAGETQGPA